MIIDLTKLTEAELDFSFSALPDLEDESARMVEPVQAEGKLRRGIAQVDVAGTISGEVELECQRCLTSLIHKFDFPFRAAFMTDQYYTSEREVELRNEDLDVSIYEGDEIDLTELVREQILLNLPTQALCRSECRGLCQVCGANLNEADCNCEEEEIDPRWLGLRDLKNNNEG